MNQVRQGCDRDRRILALVEEWGCLTAEQVASLLFHGNRAGRAARGRLLRLADLGHLSRHRPAADMGYCYFTGKRPGRMEHLVALNWARLWLTRGLPSWERVERWQYEVDMGVLVADGFAAIRNLYTKTLRGVFVELDRAAGNNRFDKVSRYCRLYQTDGYLPAWWARQVERFPQILIVGDTPARLAGALKAVDRDNKEGLRFDVRLLGQMKAEVRR